MPCRAEQEKMQPCADSWQVPQTNLFSW